MFHQQQAKSAAGNITITTATGGQRSISLEYQIKSDTIFLVTRMTGNILSVKWLFFGISHWTIAMFAWFAQ